ncbi:DNA pilot protein [Microvirus D_HF2_219]|nr:DNA pilot protein [Microvirus D_HF2_219]
MPNKNIPVQGNVSGAPLSSASDSYSGQPANPTFRPWPVDTSLPPGSSGGFDDVTYNNGNVSSVGNMLPSLLSFGSPLLGAGLGFLSNMFGFNSQLDEQLRREEFQKEWRDNERAYNHPAAQIARLNDAGLNGKLLLSQQGLSQGQTAPQNGNVSPSFDGTGPAAMLAQGGATAANMLMQQKLMQAQIDNIEAQTSKTQAETMLLPEQLKGLSLSNKGLDLSNETYSATQSSIIRKTKLEAVGQYLQNIITQSQGEMQRVQSRIMQNYGMKNADASFQLLQQEYTKISEEITNLRKLGKNIDTDTLVKQTTARLNTALSVLYNSQKKYYDAQTNSVNVETANTPRLSKADLTLLSSSMVKQAVSEAAISDIQQQMLDNTWRNTPGSPYSYTSDGAAWHGILGSLGQLLGGAMVFSVSGRAVGGRSVVKGFKP